MLGQRTFFYICCQPIHRSVFFSEHCSRKLVIVPLTKKDPATPKPQKPAAQNERREKLRQQKADLSRTHILDAAEEIFAIHGYHDATIRQIAKVAGFSPAAVYGFVDSKEELVSAILDRHANVLMELHAGVLTHTDRTPQQLDEIIDIQVDYHLAHPNFGRLFQHTIGLSFLAIESAMDETSRVRLGEQLDLLEALFSRGITEGDLHSGDPNTLATLFSSLMQGYLFRMLLEKTEQDSDRTEFHELMRRTFVRTTHGG
jgi:AcrR family transcriptional regulator